MQAAIWVKLLLLACCASLAAITRSQGLAGGAPNDLSDCDVAVVGGGPGGVYTAYRLLETNATSSVCLFEATGRLGGRIYSVHNLGPNRDLTLDMGAYRYMPLVQPIITNLIENNLQLPNRLYQPGIPDYKVILTPDGSNAGFMQNITAGSVVLNLPSRPLHRLLQASGLPRSGVNQAMLETYQIRATKLYLFYPQAWWLANGLNNGSLAYNLPWNTTTPPKVPIIGRYHDAQAKCATMASTGTVSASSVSSPQYEDYYYTNANGLNTQMCYGFFQATYTSDSGTTNISHYPLDYLVDYSSPTAGPDGIALPYTVWDNSTAMGYKLLNDSHTQIMAFLASTGKNINGPMGMPTEAIVALWDPSVDWSGGAWHSNKTVEAGEAEWSEQIIKPFTDLNLYVADEAYGTQFGWAEGSLVMAENIVREYFGATTPSWMTEETARVSRFGPTFNDYETAAQGGGSGIPLAPTTSTSGDLSANSGLAPTPSKY